jgi:hypothetical protein
MERPRLFTAWSTFIIALSLAVATPVVVASRSPLHAQDFEPLYDSPAPFFENSAQLENSNSLYADRAQISPAEADFGKPNGRASASFPGAPTGATSVLSQASEVFIADAKPYPELTNLFQNKRGWVGADSAYSIPLGNGKTLWTFGDTWIGAIENGRRVNCRMINNSAAVQDFKQKNVPLTFHWAKGHSGSFTEKSSAKSTSPKDGEPKSLWLSAQQDGSYYWPAGGIICGDELYMFLHKIKPNKNKDTLFQFDTVCDAFLQVENPTDPPEEWRHTIKDLGNNAEQLFMATACFSGDKYLYILCSYPKIKSGLNVHPQILARFPKAKLDNFEFEKLEYFCKDPVLGSSQWETELKEAVVIFHDGAPELTVTRVPGVEGIFAVYMPPLSRNIMIRHAASIEGPWSAPQLVYTCPDSKEIMVYSVKAHEELATEPGELILTYCRNSDERSHIEKPEIYFPQGLRAFIRKRN